MKFHKEKATKIQLETESKSIWELTVMYVIDGLCSLLYGNVELSEIPILLKIKLEWKPSFEIYINQ